MKLQQYPAGRTVHMGAKVATDGTGRVSALCFHTPRAIDMHKASWTIRTEAVSCQKCRMILKREGR